MAGYCKVIVLGNLTRDPELRYTPDGTPVCNFDVAVNRPVKEGQQEEVLFLRVTTWKKTAEACGQYLAKGSKVLCEGWLKENKWQDQQGNPRSRIGLVASNVQFLSRKPAEGGGTPPAESAEDVPF